MARKALPVDLLVIQGKKHLSKQEIEQRRQTEKSLKVSADKIRPPSWLNDAAKKEFKRISRELMSIDLLTNVDVDGLALYCDAYSEYIACTAIIKEEGLMVEYTNKGSETSKVAHPLMVKKKQLYEQMKSLAAEYALTPAARAKIAVPKKEEKEPTEFEKVFGDL